MSVLPQRYSLFKRSNGIYYIGYYRNGQRRWKSTGASTRPEALKALTQFRELFAERAGSVSFQKFVEQFLSFAQSNLSWKTVNIYKAVLGLFERLVGDAWLKEITPEAVDRYKALRLKEVSPVSVNVGLRALKAAFNTAKRWKFIEANPCDEVSLASVPEQAPLALSVEDFQKLISCIREGWFRELVIFSVLTGMRRGEILNLRWSDVDLSRKLIHIQTNGTFKTKQGKRRTIPLSEAAFYLLAAKHGKSPSEYVFTLNDKALNAGWVTHLFKRCVREANLSNPRFRFHSLRHTFASWLLQQGVSIYEVQKLLGHSSVKVTEGYSHLPSDRLFGAVNKISVETN